MSAYLGFLANYCVRFLLHDVEQCGHRLIDLALRLLSRLYELVELFPDHEKFLDFFCKKSNAKVKTWPSTWMSLSRERELDRELTIKLILAGLKFILAIDQVRLLLFSGCNLAVQQLLLLLQVVPLLVELLHVRAEHAANLHRNTQSKSAPNRSSIVDSVQMDDRALLTSSAMILFFITTISIYLEWTKLANLF